MWPAKKSDENEIAHEWNEWMKEAKTKKNASEFVSVNSFIVYDKFLLKNLLDSFYYTM